MKRKLQIDTSKNHVIWGDCEEWLYQIPPSRIDCIYIDPPFGTSKSGFKTIWGNCFEKRSFKEQSKGGEEHYIDWMRTKLIQAKKILKPTGSIFLHCDWNKNYRLRMLLNEVFGAKNCVNEIVWSYHRWTGKSKAFQRTHDTILFYAKNFPKHTFNELQEPYSKKSKHKSPRLSVVNENGTLDQSYVEGKREKSMRSVWDISYVNSQSQERRGYPTQKPEKLIKRIIECSTKENDVVLDFFRGGGHHRQSLSRP